MKDKPLGSIIVVTRNRPVILEKMLDETGLKGKVRTIVGGGSVTSEFAKSIGSDAYGEDAGEAVSKVNGLIDSIMAALKEVKASTDSST